MELKVTADKKLLDLLERIAAGLEQAGTSASAPADGPETGRTGRDGNRPDEPEKPAENAVTPAQTITREDVKNIAVHKIQAGKRDALKELLTKYGAAKLDKVPDEKLAAFKAELDKL